MDRERTYIAIDLKSFYASAECADRGLDPLDTNLVVADESRTEKTICLAVSPSLKSYGVSGRARLFEVVEKVREVNAERRYRVPGGSLAGESYLYSELSQNPSLAVSYIVAPPRMSLYMELSTRIHEVYLRYVSSEDIYVYSIDEVFIDVTGYLGIYGISARELAMRMILDVLQETGVTATAGVGPNLYLCKVAMDVMAKHIPPDKNGVRIAQLDAHSYREQLWAHRPITDFWRVGKGYAKKLARYGIYTMGDVALCSVNEGGEDLLYREFGVNAELLIDHAWGYEPCTLADIKAYRPQENSLSSGQVLKAPYTFERARLVVREMAQELSLELFEKGLVTDQAVLTVGYDVENLLDDKRREAYHGEIVADRYGRKVPRHAHGTCNLKMYTSSTRLITDAVLSVFDREVDKTLLVRRMNVVAAHTLPRGEAPDGPKEPVQLDIFTDYEALRKKEEEEAAALDRERRLQQASVELRKKFGKNAILKGSDLEEGATAIERNGQIGGHRK